MELTGLVSALVAGIIIGALGRLIVPGQNNLGCLLTILIGIVGAAIGLAIGAGVGAGFWLTVVFQVVVAAVLVSLFSISRR